jgi:hypothetical protein
MTSIGALAAVAGKLQAHSTSLCHKFSSIDGLKKAPDNQEVDTYIKSTTVMGSM